MSRQPMFKLAPSGDHYLISLAGVVLVCGDTIHGNPTESTPEGRARAKHMIDRVLTEAVSRGFEQEATVRALLHRNQPTGRLKNLVQQAVDLIPKPLQSKIMEEELRAAQGSPLAEAVAAMAPAPVAVDEIDPRFWEAGEELQRIAAEEGPEGIHKPEHAHLYAKMHRHAPASLQRDMAAKARELGLMPTATHVGENGQALFSAQQIADKHGVSLEEVEARIAQAVADGDIDPADLYTGPVHSLQ